MEFIQEEVSSALKNASSGNGPDNIPGKLLQCLANQLSPHVTVLFNHVLKTGIFPKQWKQSYVTPLYKKGNRNCVSSYRPISNLSKLSLVLERLVFDKLYQFVKKAISSQQYGFMKRKSTTLHFLDFVMDAYRCNDNKEIMYTLYVDFAKAFDKVSHPILLEKLHRFGVCGHLLQFFRSYLSERYQCVKIHDLLSSALPITSGVPQGSVLGPLLYIIFINDLPDSIQSSYLRMFADDTKISNTNILALEQDGKNLVHRALKNEMMFNTDKTVFFSVPYCEAETSFNDFRLSTSKVCKDLDLYLTPELFWDEHLKRKLGHLNSMLIRLKRELPVSVGSQVEMVLFKSYFLSSLLYNSQVWYPSQKMLDKLELFQKRATQWILDIKDYHQRLRALKLFPISYQLQMADLTFLNKLCNVHQSAPNFR